MDGKLKIKAKGLEIEWEGDVEFLRDHLSELVRSIVDAVGEIDEEDIEADAPQSKAAESGSAGFTTSGLAAKLRAESGPELFKIALARIQLGEGKETATRAEIVREMRTAKAVYKETMNKNLSQTITNLQKADEINEPTSGHFALRHPQLELYKRETGK